MDKTSLGKIYLTFAKVGITTFGGGYAMLPILQRDVVENNKWVSEEELIDFYAVGQSIPGLIAINVATLIGRKERGVVGGIMAALGMITPCVIIITLIAALLSGFRDNEIVKHALSGISVCVVALILTSVIKLFKGGVTCVAQLLVALAALAVSVFLDISPIYIIIGGAIFGVLYGLIVRRKSS